MNKYKSNRGFTIIELLVVVAIIMMLSVMIFLGAAGCSVSDGNRVGVITKFSKRGAFIKSWEGEMAMTGLRQKENGVSPNIWYFTVKNGDIDTIQTIESIQESGHRCKITYNQTLFYNPFVRDTAYWVNKVVDLEAEVLTNRVK